MYYGVGDAPVDIHVRYAPLLLLAGTVGERYTPVRGMIM